MKLVDLQKVYVYKNVAENNKGEFTTDWQYLAYYYVNIQQDVNELDRNDAGEIDYEIIKLRTDRPMDIQKGYGISLKETEIPEYKVESTQKIGNSYLFRCSTYHGE